MLGLIPIIGQLFYNNNQFEPACGILSLLDILFVCNFGWKLKAPLLAFIALSAAQSSAQTRIHNAILVIDTSNNASYNQAD